MRAILLPFTVSMLLALTLSAAAQEAPEVGEVPEKDAVATGHEALEEAADFPWYDAEKDDVRRIYVKPPRQPIEWTWGDWFSGWSFSNPFNLSFLELLPWLAVIAVVILLVIVGIRLARSDTVDLEQGQALARKKKLDPARLEALPFPVNREVSDLLAEARRLYEAGNYAQAVIYLFSHQLVELDRHQLIRLARGKTNRQYVRELRGRDGLRGMLETTMFAFEDVFFGAHALERDRFEACWSNLGKFDELVAGSATT